ncbi:MAG: hypothetical protein CL924_03490 [Deltaproteobacteria bacterium]|nr:MAG: hypothetical protein CL924_03490 [Deltaproteobacteria bacterium]
MNKTLGKQNYKVLCFFVSLHYLGSSFIACILNNLAQPWQKQYKKWIGLFEVRFFEVVRQLQTLLGELSTFNMY